MLVFRSIYGCLSAKAVIAVSHNVLYKVIMKVGNAVYKIPCVQIAFSNAGLRAKNAGGFPCRTKPEFFRDTNSRTATMLISDKTMNNRKDSQGHLIFQDFHSFLVF